jgi:hypothetical protein
MHFVAHMKLGEGRTFGKNEKINEGVLRKYEQAKRTFLEMLPGSKG